MSRSHHLDLPFILPSQSQKHVTHNQALENLDVVVQASVQSRDMIAPPQNPMDGARYIIGGSPTGVWANKALTIASWLDGTWSFYPPKMGWRVWIEGEARLVVFDGTEWRNISASDNDSSAPSIKTLPALGINANIDSVSKLTVKSPSVLLGHDTDDPDMRLVVNKEIDTATGSLLLQSGYSGRAEIGLNGSNDFSVKVSPDGTAWHTALSVDKASGSISFPNTVLNNNASINVTMLPAARLSPAFKIVGTSRDNSADAEEGVGLYLTHNGTGNRQFTLMSTDDLLGLRVVIAGNTPTIDGYQNGARRDLQIGSNTHGAHIGPSLSGTQLSVSNWTGTATKTVFEIMGAASQSADYVTISSGPSARGDIFKIDSGGTTHLSAPLQLAMQSKTALPSPAQSGGLVFVSDAQGGPCPAYSDGQNWRRVSDQSIID